MIDRVSGESPINYYTFYRLFPRTNATDMDTVSTQLFPFIAYAEDETLGSKSKKYGTPRSLDIQQFQHSLLAALPESRQVGLQSSRIDRRRVC